MNLPNQAQLYAGGRHVVTFAMGGVTAAAALHVINGGQASDAATAINQIGSGVASIIAGVSTLVAIGSGIYATLSASPLWQIFHVAQIPNTTVVTTSAIAQATPTLPNVVSATDNKVVSK